VGEWFRLPYTKEELNAALQRIGIAANGRYEEYFITDYENDLGLKVGEYESLSALNGVAKCVESFNADEVRLLQAVIELEGVDVSRAVEVIGRLCEYTLHPDITNEEELGRYTIHDTGKYNLEAIGKLAEYLDYEAYGRDVNINSNGGFTSFGWVSH